MLFDRSQTGVFKSFIEREIWLAYKLARLAIHMSGEIVWIEEGPSPVICSIMSEKACNELCLFIYLFLKRKNRNIWH